MFPKRGGPLKALRTNCFEKPLNLCIRREISLLIIYHEERFGALHVPNVDASGYTSRSLSLDVTCCYRLSF